MKTINRFLHIAILAVALLSATTASAVDTDNNATFAHYYGEAHVDDPANGYDSKGYQKAPEVHYYYYVNANRSNITLLLPFENYTSGGGDMEPRGWIRWYDYNTDMESPNLTANGSQLKTIYATVSGKLEPKGLFAYNFNVKPSHSTVGVVYVPPTGAESSDWEGETIACDVSRFIDYTDATYPQHEPTLSIRCIYHIKSAASLADDMMDVVTTHKPTRLTYQDNRTIDFGVRLSSGPMNLRLDLSSVGSYYFHPMSSAYTFNHHIYYPDDKAATYQITEDHFDSSTVVNATGVEWRVYDSTKTKWTTLSESATTSIFQSLSIIGCTGNSRWRDIDGNTTTAPSIGVGDYVYVVAYVVNGTNKCPVANCKVRFTNTYPLIDDERTTGYRSRSYIDNNYKQYEVASLDFDNISSKQTDTAPTNGIDNMAPLPLEMTNCGYGFVYPSLVNKEKYGWGGNNTPIHGEYHIIKSCNLSGISTSSQGYHWWRATPIYDRTYIKTNGNQWGYYAYLDASDESRRVLAVDFNGNLCTGTRLIFEGYVCDVTSGSERPQVMFRLYGIDSKGEAQIIQSFASGNLGSNHGSSVGDIRDQWFQIYGQVTISATDNVSKYSKFRLAIDNMCTNTNGADYCIDDVHIYMRNAKIDVVQDTPMCPDENGTSVLNNIRFKLRGDYESVQALAANNNTLYYRICKADGTPLKLDYDDDDDVEDYGAITIPAAYDATLEMGTKDGGPTQKVFETDQYDNVMIVLANRHFDLEENVKYYVSVTYPDADGNPTQWGSPNDVCSCYSEFYTIAKQSSVITDANGKIATEIQISCDDSEVKTYTITAKIQTVDPINGGTVTLEGVSFDWFCDTDNNTDFNDVEYNSIKLATALNHFRTVYPKATGIQRASGVFTSDDRTVLQYFIRKGYLSLDASSKMPIFDGFEGQSGIFHVYAIPISTEMTVGGITYDICPTALVYTFHLSTTGPKVIFGFANVTYPTDESNRRLRIGKPQLNTLAQGGSLTIDVPVHSIVYYDNSHTYTGVQKISSGAVYVTDTNDPTWDLSDKHQVAIVTNTGTITAGQNINLSFSGSEATSMREGYWYDLTLYFNAAYQTGTATDVVSCPGESTMRFIIVPEYLTWNSIANTNQNANWNNDANWTRSLKSEIYKNDNYEDYRTDGAYVPMKFSKVIIPIQQGSVYPYLSSIIYNAANGIATNLANVKGDASTYIQYDLMCSWNYDTEDGSTDGKGTFGCERFYGNTCDQIYLKPEGEVLHENYLVYNKAWADREFKAGKWALVSSPLKNTYSGDMYVPVANGKQETEAFNDITFSTSVNNRITMPVYQRAWDKSNNEVLADGSTIKAYDYSGTGITLDDTGISAASPQWSHSFNDVTYAFGNNGNEGVGGIALKVGDDYYFNNGGTALMRLPKADTSYTYYAPDGTMRTSETLQKDSCNRFIMEPRTSAAITYRLAQDNTSNRYFLVGNPYTATISMYQFINENTMLERKVWILNNGTLTGCAVPDEGDADYKKNDILITPMSAFIVKLKDGETPGTVSFSPDIITDRWISGASTASDNGSTQTLTLNVVAGDMQSTAVVNCKASADNAYVESEDVEILDSHLDSTPMVYTVASDKAVSINNTDRIDWLPVGIASTASGTAQLTITTKGIYHDLYLYDALTRTSERIESGKAIEVKENAHGRYFITDYEINGSVDTETADQCTIKCYSPERGLLTVKASQPETMMSVAIYDASGRQMAAKQTDGRIQADFQLTSGVYVVSATLSDGTIRTEKAYVR